MGNFYANIVGGSQPRGLPMLYPVFMRLHCTKWYCLFIHSIVRSFIFSSVAVLLSAFWFCPFCDDFGGINRSMSDAVHCAAATNIDFKRMLQQRRCRVIARAQSLTLHIHKHEHIPAVLMCGSTLEYRHTYLFTCTAFSHVNGHWNEFRTTWMCICMRLCVVYERERERERRVGKKARKGAGETIVRRNSSRWLGALSRWLGHIWYTPKFQAKKKSRTIHFLLSKFYRNIKLHISSGFILQHLFRMEVVSI